MKITKLGHCCLLIEVAGRRVLTDPGMFTVAQHSAVRDIDVVVITHEHGDHCHTDSVVDIVAANPNVQIVCNASVGAVLQSVELAYTTVAHGQSVLCAGVPIRAHDSTHAEIYEAVGQVPTTGYLIGERLFCPGDSWDQPEFSVEVLALPVAGPWCRIADAIRFALAVRPATVFPVHDGLLNEQGVGITYSHPATQLTAANITFTPLRDGATLVVE